MCAAGLGVTVCVRSRDLRTAGGLSWRSRIPCCGRAQGQLLRIVHTCRCVLLRCFRQGQVTESSLLKHSFLLAQLCLQNFICYQLVFINNTFSHPFRRTLSNSGLYPASLASFQKSVFPGIVFFFFF